MLLTGRPSDDRLSCPPPITAERARQNVPSASSYMSLKHSHAQRASGSFEQDALGSSAHRASLSSQSTSHTAGQHGASSQRAYDGDTPSHGGQKKKVRHSFRNSHLVKIATTLPSVL